MIKVTVYSNDYVQIDGEKYPLRDEEAIIKFLTDLIGKIRRSREYVSLEYAKQSETGTEFQELGGW